MFYQGQLHSEVTIVLVVNAKISQVDAQSFLTPHANTEVVPRPHMHVTGLKQVVELCSGMGCMGVGLRHAGFEICIRNDCNPHM